MAPHDPAAQDDWQTTNEGRPVDPSATGRAALAERLLLGSFGDEYLYFKEYTGPSPKRTWRKPVVGPPDRPFAELHLVQRLEADGWTAAWACRGAYLRTWEPRTEAAFPDTALELLRRIQKRAAGKAMCWDVFAWRNGEPRFIQLHRYGSAVAERASRTRWQEAARVEGVPQSAFSRLEWMGGSFEGYALKVMSVEGITVRGWIRYSGHGEFEFGGDRAEGMKGWLDSCQRDTGLSGGDLCWALFIQNAGGVRTYFDIKQVRSRRSRSGQHPKPKNRQA